MSTVPFWFDSNAYIKNKAAAMGMDSLALLQAFKNAGFGTDAEGLYSHFVQFGSAEGHSPNAFFNGNEYLYAKATSFFGTTNVTDQHVKSMVLAFNQNGFTAWSHFQMNWAEDFATKSTFHNPSASFDTGKYMADKLAKMQADPAFGPSYTMAQLVQAFKDNGLDPVSHYLLAGQSEGLVPVSVSSGTPGNTYQLTYDDDEIFGTRGDDYFNAKVDTLNDNDYIDGGAGNDTLYANIKAEGTDRTAIAPEITNVENIIFRAQTDSSNGGGNNISQSYIDAGNITGMKMLGSDNSRADLEVEDVRIDSDQMTIRMSNTDPAVDFTVYFDPQHLKAEGSVTSGNLLLQVIDGENAPAGQPLQQNPFDAVRFSYLGVMYEVKFGVVNGTDGYTELRDAIQTAIDAIPELAGVTANLGDSFTWVNKLGTSVTGTTIVLKSPAGDFSSVNGGWVASAGVPADSNVSTRMTQDNPTTCPLIVTNVELDNVARVQWDDASACLPDNSIYGSQAGELVIGSMPGRGGVEKFMVTVDRGSWLSSLSSTNNALRYIDVKNGDVPNSTRTDNDSNHKDDNKGNLFIGRSVEAAATGTDLELTDWMNVPRLLTTDGLVDVKEFHASTMLGKVNIGASITEASRDKYLVDVDGTSNMGTNYAPDGPFEYNLGTNDDTLNMLVEGGIAADRDFVLKIATNDGADLVNFNFDFNTGNQVINQVNLKNVSINTGAGDDTVWSWGRGNATGATAGGGLGVHWDPSANSGNGAWVGGFDMTVRDQVNQQYDGASGYLNIITGEGANAVYASQDAAVHNAVWVLNGNNFAPANENPWGIDHNAVNGAQPHNNNVASTVNEWSLTGKTASAAYTLNAVVEFCGIKVTVKVGDYTASAAGAYSVKVEQLNAALIKAINDDATLSKLLVAKDGAGKSLLVESIIDGQFGIGSLTNQFNVTFNDVTGNTTVGLTNPFGAGYVAAANDASDVGSDQVITFTVAAPTIGDTYTLTLDGVAWTTAALTAATAADVVAKLGAVTVGSVQLDTLFTITDSGNNIILTAITPSNDHWYNTAVITQTGTGTVSGLAVSSTDLVTGTDHHYYGGSNITGGAGDDVIVTGYADATVIAGAGNDTIIVGDLTQNTITGGIGADHIVLGRGNIFAHTVADEAKVDTLIQAMGDTGKFVTPTTTSIDVSTFDTIFNFDTSGAAATPVRDIIQVSGYTAAGGAAAGTWGTSTLVALTAVSTAAGADNTMQFVTGWYDDVTGTFNTAGAGTNGVASTLLVYDANSATTAQSFEAVVLVGVTGTAVDLATATGNITVTA